MYGSVRASEREREYSDGADDGDDAASNVMSHTQWKNSASLEPNVISAATQEFLTSAWFGSNAFSVDSYERTINNCHVWDHHGVICEKTYVGTCPTIARSHTFVYVAVQAQDQYELPHSRLHCKNDSANSNQILSEMFFFSIFVLFFKILRFRPKSAWQWKMIKWSLLRVLRTISLNIANIRKKKAIPFVSMCAI